MPTDGVSLLLYVGLLLPGFAFSLTRRRHRPLESKSAFFETTTAVFVSVLAVALVLSVLLAACSLLPMSRAAVLVVAADPASSISTHPFAWWFGTTGFLTTSTAVGAVSGSRTVQVGFDRLVHGGRGSGGSSWHWVFKEALPDGTEVILVTAELTDGSWVQGVLSSWDRSATDTPERGIVLAGAIARRTSVGEPFISVPDASAVVLVDRNIRSMQVTHLAESWPPPPTFEENAA